MLRARDYAESDRIVTLLTLHAGKLSGIAKGAKASRHRFERKLEPFSHVVLHFRRRPHGQLVFITRAEAADLTQHVLDDDLAKIALGSYMLELTDALTTEESEAAEAYRVLSEASARSARGSRDAALRQAFELRLLGWAGFGLEFTRCRICATLNAVNGAWRDGVFRRVARRNRVREMPAVSGGGRDQDVEQGRGDPRATGRVADERFARLGSRGSGRRARARALHRFDRRSPAAEPGISRFGFAGRWQSSDDHPPRFARRQFLRYITSGSR